MIYDYEFIDEFRNILYTGENDKNWLYKYDSNTIIYDCILSGDNKMNSAVSFCSAGIGYQKILNLEQNSNYLLSELLFYIVEYIMREKITPPYNIFCSFCLGDDNTMNQDIKNYQDSIKAKVPFFFVNGTNEISNSVLY